MHRSDLGNFRQDRAKKPIRVLVVDDSALMRKLISQIVASQEDMEVAGIARDGQEALESVRTLDPDVITLDIEMPRMNGVEFLEAIMKEAPRRVVMISSLSKAGAEITFSCLQLGAIDFVAKPSGSISLDLLTCKEEIAQKIRLAAQAQLRLNRRAWGEAERNASAIETQEPRRLSATRQQAKGGRGFVVVAIASSTGGPAALTEILTQMPPDLNAAYIVVQHLPTGFSRMFCARLDSICALKVREARLGDSLEAGVVLVAPGGVHLFLDGEGKIAFSEDPPLWGVRPAADMLLPSVASLYGERVVSVTLTGMGRDGSLGVKAVRAAGGVCFAQDEASCVVFGMPRAAWETGAVERLTPLHQMPTTLIEKINQLSHATAKGVKESGLRGAA